MKRRAFLLAPPLAALATTRARAQTAPAAPTINVMAELKALRIASGPFAGAFEIAPNGRINWYFTALGLLPVVQFLSRAELEAYIRPYLDLYLRTLNPNLSIDDIDLPYGRANPTVFTRVPSDSDDSYAATFLSLAVRYLRASSNWAWWDANKQKMKDLAYRNLALTLKANGLTSVFQAPRNATNSIGYLMDNCEVYRGVRDFASLMRERGDRQDADYADLVATSIGNGIVRLYRAASAAFTPGDGYTRVETMFYPGTTCQVFPQAFGVTEAAGFFASGWNYFNTNSPGWEDGRYDVYPWAVLGFVAAQRGLYTQARAQMATIERLFASNRAMVTINELGFYQRTRNVMAGIADV